jgi:hypothetical protein
MSLPPSARRWLAWRAANNAPKRQRGGQPANLNALRHGIRTAVAIARERELSTLLADAKRSIACAKPFIRKRKKRSPTRNFANE